MNIGFQFTFVSGVRNQMLIVVVKSVMKEFERMKMCRFECDLVEMNYSKVVAFLFYSGACYATYFVNTHKKNKNIRF